MKQIDQKSHSVTRPFLSRIEAGNELMISNLMSLLSHLNVYVFFLCLLFVFSACKQDFQPLEANDEFFFSMYGFLDASADTQWIHITPIREQAEMTSDGTGIAVTLLNIETGSEIVMNDSLFQRGQDFLNFWTDEPIEHNQTYRLTAELQTGEKSEVTVTTPEEMPTPKVAVQTIPGAPPEYYALVDRDIHLADIQTKYYVKLLAPNLDVQRTFSFAYRNDAKITEDFPGYYSVQIDPEAEIAEIERQVLLPPDGEIEVVYSQVFVAASGLEWQEEIESLDDVTYALPQTLRNVENGLGYVIGIDSKYIPYEGCQDFEGNIITCGEEDPFW